MLGMHGETCRTLLQLIRHAIRRKYLEKNIHLVYALLLEQGVFQKMNHCKCVNIFELNILLCMYMFTYYLCHVSLHYTDTTMGDMSSITALIDKANVIIQEKSDGMSAGETLGVLKANIKKLKSYQTPEGLVSEEDSVAASSEGSVSSDQSDLSDIGNLTFQYEEEADPEVFFVPYIWDVIVGTLTTTTMEWTRNKIQIFPLNEDEVVEPLYESEMAMGSQDDTGSTLDNTEDVV